MTQQMHAQMGGSTEGSEELIAAGAVSFGLEYRTNVGAMNDEGICIHVYGNDIEGDDKELLRFDCFRISPHYHYRNAPIGQNHRLELDFTAEEIRWPGHWTKSRTVCRLCCSAARANSTARQVDQRDVAAAVPHIVAWAETKTHNRA